MTSINTKAVRRNNAVADLHVETHADWAGVASGAIWFVAFCVLLTAIAAIASNATPAMVPFALALGPACIAAGLAWREGDGALRHLLRSLTIRPSERRWYLVVLLPVAWALATVAMAVALGHSSTGLFDRLTPAAFAIPLVVLIPAVAEELAWRGFSLPRAMTAMSPMRASLVLAIPWALMHLVLQLPGGINASVSWWPTIVSIFAYSVILTWVFLGTGGSVLITALVHTGLNGVVPLMWGLNAEAAWEIRSVLAALLAVTIVALGGLRRSRNPA
jgi:membrane protease YdiL (CAAX protease family)